MKTGIYIGSKQELKGENALLEPDGAQLAFGWHLFERKEFQMKGE